MTFDPIEPGEDEVVANIQVVINCPGISSSGMASVEESMKDAIKQYFLEQTLQAGIQWQTDDGLEFYLTDSQLEWQPATTASLDVPE